MPGRYSVEREAFLAVVAYLSRLFLPPVDNHNCHHAARLCRSGDCPLNQSLAGLDVEAAASANSNPADIDAELFSLGDHGL